jgi:hypothetical protein
MRIGFALCVVTFGATLLIGSTAVLAKQSHLEAMANRHDLRDELCIALADGVLTQWERAEILADAQRILEPKEFEGFKQALDRISPPPAKKPNAKRSQRQARTKMPAMTTLFPQPKKPAIKTAKPEAGPIIPTSAVLPDRMALIVFAR